MISPKTGKIENFRGDRPLVLLMMGPAEELSVLIDGLRRTFVGMQDKDRLNAVIVSANYLKTQGEVHFSSSDEINIRQPSKPMLKRPPTGGDFKQVEINLPPSRESSDFKVNFTFADPFVPDTLHPVSTEAPGNWSAAASFDLYPLQVSRRAPVSTCLKHGWARAELGQEEKHELSVQQDSAGGLMVSLSLTPQLLKRLGSNRGGPGTGFAVIRLKPPPISKKDIPKWVGEQNLDAEKLAKIMEDVRNDGVGGASSNRRLFFPVYGLSQLSAAMADSVAKVQGNQARVLSVLIEVNPQ
jgi:hypothetical protein